MKPMLCELELSKPSNRRQETFAPPESDDCSTTPGQQAFDLSDLLVVDGRTEQSAKARLERRSQKRAQVRLAARICPADSTSGNCSEIIATANASRQGLYFVTNGEWCHVGMRVRVIFPYDPACDRFSNQGDLGEVTRMERLRGGRVGVAVLLRKPAPLAQPAAGAAPMPLSAEKNAKDRRTITRHPFVAEAVVVELHAKSRLRTRCVDLSLQGCYVDTMNPFPLGTMTRVELRTADGVFEAIASVNSSHVGMGMGLCFQNLTPAQTAVLVDWLGTDRSERVWVSNPASPASPSEAPDRAFAKSLVRDLLARGVLTREDITDIFFGSPVVSPF